MSKCLLPGLLCHSTVHRNKCKVLSLSTICHRRSQRFHVGLGSCVTKGVAAQFHRCEDFSQKVDILEDNGRDVSGS